MSLPGACEFACHFLSLFLSLSVFFFFCIFFKLKPIKNLCQVAERSLFYTYAGEHKENRIYVKGRPLGRGKIERFLSERSQIMKVKKTKIHRRCKNKGLCSDDGDGCVAMTASAAAQQRRITAPTERDNCQCFIIFRIISRQCELFPLSFLFLPFY